MMFSAMLAACDSRRAEWPDVLVDRAIDGEPLPHPMTGYLMGPTARRPNDPRYEQRRAGDIERRFLEVFRTDVRIVMLGLDRFTFRQLREMSKNRGLPVCGTRRMLSAYLAACCERPAAVEDALSEAFLRIPTLFSSDELESMAPAHIFALVPRRYEAHRRGPRDRE